MTIEELFKKANNERIELNGHKERLKTVLLKNEYFDIEQKEYWDWKLTFSSLAFSAMIIVFSYSVPAVGNSNVAVDESKGLYTSLEKSNNVSSLGAGDYNGESANILQMVEDGTETTMYFNNRNVLIHSEVNNK
ncbi:hypothetical protein M0Q50_08400 [bacterium]|jgi:hypothetical protein|nr:hypothetical protein [bacterium]